MPLVPGARLRSRPGGDRRRHAAPGAADVHQLPEQPHRRGPPGRTVRPGDRVRRGQRDPGRARQRLQRDHLRRLRGAVVPADAWAKDVGVEVFSLSKGYNMTGWRCAAIVGNAEAIGQYWRLKSNIDSGLFEAVQLAGAAALAPEVDAERQGDERCLPAPARPGVRRAGPGRRRGHAAQGNDLRLGADPGRLRVRRGVLRARARRGRRWSSRPVAPTAPAARASSRISLTTPDDRLVEAVRADPACSSGRSRRGSGTDPPPPAR